ncbi:hypothetical protein E7Y31_15140 [Candidatus Frankia alpina]|uniref:Uncharacterized protein n=1 Tax=Candidatus Frankia alpina TaxID=2699483 RepID=A0A4S5EIS5_9ACTN|nr:hypothetical protein E7Y31_15140 [Candidatus Frankia alpina]
MLARRQRSKDGYRRPEYPTASPDPSSGSWPARRAGSSAPVATSPPTHWSGARSTGLDPSSQRASLGGCGTGTEVRRGADRVSRSEGQIDEIAVAVVGTSELVEVTITWAGGYQTHGQATHPVGRDGEAVARGCSTARRGRGGVRRRPHQRSVDLGHGLPRLCLT